MGNSGVVWEEVRRISHPQVDDAELRELHFLAEAKDGS